MQQIIFEIENKEDANLLIAIANRIGVRRYTTIKKTKDKGVNKLSKAKEKAGKTGLENAPFFIEGDDTVDISGLSEILTEKNLDPSELRKSLWERKK